MEHPMETMEHQVPYTVACPVCRRPVAWQPENRYRPFCSRHCKLADLGAWADGSRTIACGGEWDDEPV